MTAVLDSAGRRTTVSDPAVLESPTAVADLLAQEPLVARLIDVRDADGDAPIPALLIDASGRPLGPSPASPGRLSLPADLQGWAVAPGRVAAQLQVMPTYIRARLYRAAWVRGRVRGAAWIGGSLHFRDFGDGRASPRDDAAPIDDRGQFSLGPLPVGRKEMVVEGIDAELSEDARIAVLHAGRQDLGTLTLEPLHPLHLAVERDDGTPFSGLLYLSIHALGTEPSHGLPVAPHEVREGRLALPRFRRLPVSLTAWTDDGRLGTGPTDGLLAERTSRLQPVTIVLSAAGDLLVQVSTPPFEVPDGCVLLAYPTRYHLARHSFLRCSFDQPEQRVRRSIVPRGDLARLDQIWPGPTGLALVSPHGAVLGEREVHVFPGARTTIALAPVGPIAALDVAGARIGQRFALLQPHRGVVLRARVDERPLRLFVEAGIYEIHGLDAANSTALRTIEAVAGEARLLQLE